MQRTVPTGMLMVMMGVTLLCSVAFASSMGGSATQSTGDFVLPLIGVVASLAGALVSAFSVAVRQSGKQTATLLDHLREDRKVFASLVSEERESRKALIQTQERIGDRLDRIAERLDPRSEK